MAHQGETCRALRLAPWRNMALALKKILIRFTLISPYARLCHARLLDKAPMARALGNPPSPRWYMATEPSPECALRHGAKGERHFKHSIQLSSHLS
ncbi:unnamed protein product [Brassica rapa]|uniref:Uncharacterized protein n=1 Tax=Brassica campestris TaxID=3711 RepID=A0A8D9M2L9_BRACM|nr:unnamed protein product [Brassica rapa]